MTSWGIHNPYPITVGGYKIQHIILDNDSGTAIIFLKGPSEEIHMHSGIINGRMPLPDLEVTVTEDWVSVKKTGRGSALFKLDQKSRYRIEDMSEKIVESLENEEVFERY